MIRFRKRADPSCRSPGPSPRNGRQFYHVYLDTVGKVALLGSELPSRRGEGPCRIENSLSPVEKPPEQQTKQLPHGYNNWWKFLPAALSITLITSTYFLYGDLCFTRYSFLRWQKRMTVCVLSNRAASIPWMVQRLTHRAEKFIWCAPTSRPPRVPGLKLVPTSPRSTLRDHQFFRDANDLFLD